MEYIGIYLGEALECLDSAGAELVKYKNESQNDEKARDRGAFDCSFKKYNPAMEGSRNFIRKKARFKAKF